MKCRKCGATASINMPQHRLALCKAHYFDWFQEQTLKTIEKYQMATKSERILVAVSGGKDSLALWDTLYRSNYTVDGLYIHLGIDTEYSVKSMQFTQQFATERQLHLHVFYVQKEFGNSIPEMIDFSQRGENSAPAHFAV